MRLRWERARQGMARGFADSGEQLAQVAHVLGPGGEDRGWMVWLCHEGELFERSANEAEAKAAAEAALSRSIDEDRD